MIEITQNPTHESVPDGKVPVQLLLDSEVLAYYRTQAGQHGYQKLINDILRSNIEQAERKNRALRIRSLRGKYAFVCTSSDEFIQRKQQEINIEG